MRTRAFMDGLTDLGETDPEGLALHEAIFLQEVLLNVGLSAKLFPRVQINVPHPGEIPWSAGGVAHLDIAHYLPGVHTGPIPFIPTGGKGASPWAAFMSSVGEAMERVLTLLHGVRARGQDLWTGSYRELAQAGAKALGPDQLHLFHSEQYASPGFPFSPFTADQRLTWIRGWDLLSGEEVWAPAQLVAFGFSRSDEPRLGYASSGGLATGPTKAHTLLHGCLEYAERDANNIRWVARIPPLKVRLSLAQALTLCGHTRVSYSPRLRFDLFFWPIEIRGVCVLTVHLIHEGFRYYTYFPGIGVGLDFVSALRHAFGECAQAQLFISLMHDMYRRFGHHAAFYFVEEDEEPQNVDNLFKTVFYYGYPKNLSRIYEEFFDHAPEIEMGDLTAHGIEIRLGESDPQVLLKITLQRMAEAGLHPVAFSLTPPEVAHSLCITKVIVPELTPYYSARYPLLGHPRYAMAPEILESPRKLTLEGMNKTPLPYP